MHIQEEACYEFSPNLAISRPTWRATLSRPYIAHKGRVAASIKSLAGGPVSALPSIIMFVSQVDVLAVSAQRRPPRSNSCYPDNAQVGIPVRVSCLSSRQADRKLNFSVGAPWFRDRKFCSASSVSLLRLVGRRSMRECWGSHHLV